MLERPISGVNVAHFCPPKRYRPAEGCASDVRRKNGGWPDERSWDGRGPNPFAVALGATPLGVHLLRHKLRAAVPAAPQLVPRSLLTLRTTHRKTLRRRDVRSPGITAREATSAHRVLAGVTRCALGAKLAVQSARAGDQQSPEDPDQDAPLKLPPRVRADSDFLP